MSTAAALLTRSEFLQLQAGLSLVQLKAPLEKEPLEKEKPSASASPALGKARDLKQSDSDVSLNSLGLPKMFDSPKKEAASSSCQKAGEDPDRKPWVKLRKTIAQNPKRVYLQGTTDGLEKLRLVVEVPERRTPDFEEIIDEIKAALEKDHLTKAEAIAMRERLYAKKGC